MSLKNNPIGVFDSGVGGITVLKELKKLMPNEDFIYFGDTARSPYGPRSKIVIEEYSYNIAKFLLSFNVKAIVVACNTASSLALDFLHEKFPQLPIFGVIEPGVELAIKKTKNKKIGVIGTVGTIESGSYYKKLKEKDTDLIVFSQACPLFVPLIEEGWKNHKVMDIVIEEYLKDIAKSGIDTLILGCTHYPVIKEKIQQYLGNKIQVIDSAEAISLFLKENLKKLNLLSDKTSKGEVMYFVSNEPERFKQLTKNIIGEEIPNVQVVIW